MLVLSPWDARKGSYLTRFNFVLVPKGKRLICKSLIRKDCLSTEREKIGRKILGSSAMQQGLLSIQVP